MCSMSESRFGALKSVFRSGRAVVNGLELRDCGRFPAAFTTMCHQASRAENG